MSAAGSSVLACAGCRAEPARDAPFPFRCARAAPGDDADHVLARRLDLSRLHWPDEPAANPFARYRTLLHSWHAARAGGLDDAAYLEIVEGLDGAVAAVDGPRFTETPCARQAALGDALGFAAEGGVWVKDETGNVAGSHKARHLMGVALWLEVMERLARARRGTTLAIASCGNAALAAAVVARAARRPLEVFVPADADPRVVAALEELGARLSVCPRVPGERGDPCLRRFREAVREGRLPFGCQGSENGLAIEGGGTLGYEMVSALARDGVTLDRLFVQVGGGALASACIAAFREAVALGACARMPRIHAVQTCGGHPLERAYGRVAARVLREPRTTGAGVDPAARAERMRAPESAPAVAEALRYAADHRSEFMWPWEETPHSVASGILDDETYDWHAVVTGMIETGGYPVVVPEDALLEAHALARSATGARASHTGTAGLAGLMTLRRARAIRDGERVAVLFTGVER